MRLGTIEFNDGPIVVLWSKGDRRRVIIPNDHNDSKVLLKRVLGRFRGGRHQYESLMQSWGRLFHVNQPLLIHINGHTVGAVRPYVLGGAQQAPEPTLLTRPPVGDTPPYWFLVSDLPAGRDLARRLRDEVQLDVRLWRAFDGEHHQPPAMKFFTPMPGDQVVLRTRLEEELVHLLTGRRQLPGHQRQAA